MSDPHGPDADPAVAAAYAALAATPQPDAASMGAVVDALAAAYEALALAPGPYVARTVADLRSYLDIDGDPYDDRETPPRAVVMTMGALHEGHARLISGAREWLMTRYDLDEPDEAQVVVTIFVNPTQFGPGEDFHQYPRTFESDLEVCREHGADVVFAPTPDQLYPHGTGGITIDPGPLGDELEGAVRPGHFRGVLTVVHKLLMLTEPEAALFGEKDYQQLTLIRRMVRDLNIPVDIVGVPTVREDGTGLALSSRNRYLSDEQRHQARILPIVLATGEEALETSVSPPADVVDLLRQALLASPGVESVDYLELRGPDLGPPPESGEARLLVAARIGGVRLIDNVMMRIGDRA